MAFPSNEMETISQTSIESLTDAYSSSVPFKRVERLERDDTVASGIYPEMSIEELDRPERPNPTDSISSHLTLMKAMARFVGLGRTISRDDDNLLDDHISNITSTSHTSSSPSSLHRSTSSLYRLPQILTNVFVLHPTGTEVLYWNLIVCFIVAYNLIFIPVRFAFPLFQERYRSFWYCLDFSSDVYYLLDIFVQLRISYLDHGCLESNWKPVALHYIRSKRFIYDIIALIPIDLLSIYSHLTPYHNYVVCLRTIRLLKGYKVKILVDRVEARSDHPNIIRIVALVIILMTLIHINGCVYFVISTLIGYGSGLTSWAYPGTSSLLPQDVAGLTVVTPLSDLWTQYLYCLHWSTQMLTTIGEVNAPTRDVEYLYATLLLLFGVLMFATLVGNVGTIITNLNAARTRFESRLDNVKQYMHNRNINNELKESVLRWFDHLWEKSRGIDEQETLQNLPNKLRARIAINANKRILQDNPIYIVGDEGFRIDLMLRFRSELFPPNEIIYEKGHIGNELYVIRSGTVELSNRALGQVQVELEDGQHFGISCVINFNEFGRERSETAKTIGFCDLLVLEKKDLLELLIDYPNVKVKLDQYFVRHFKTEQRRKDQKHDIHHLTKYIYTLSKHYNELEEQYQQLIIEHNRLLALYPNVFQ